MDPNTYKHLGVVVSRKKQQTEETSVAVAPLSIFQDSLVLS